MAYQIEVTLPEDQKDALDRALRFMSEEENRNIRIESLKFPPQKTIACKISFIVESETQAIEKALNLGISMGQYLSEKWKCRKCEQEIRYIDEHPEGGKASGDEYICFECSDKENI